MRSFDFSSWHGVLSTLLGLALFTVIGVGLRVVMMLTIQQRQQRVNRQINERLRTLMAAYRTLGGSFTGELRVSPAHLRELRASVPAEELAARAEAGERARRIRDAVEAALSDVLLLGTEDQVRLASQAARDLAEGRAIEVAPLVVSLRDYIREALDLGPIPKGVTIPLQGPTRPAAGGGKGKAEGRAGSGGSGGAGGGGGGGGMGMGVGMGGGMGMGAGSRHDPDAG